MDFLLRPKNNRKFYVIRNVKDYNEAVKVCAQSGCGQSNIKSLIEYQDNHTK